MADFTAIDSADKLVQVFQDGSLVQEFPNVFSTEIGLVDALPSGGGKLAITALDTPVLCFYVGFQQGADFSIQGSSIMGDEVRILSTTDAVVENLTEFQLLLTDIPELIITEAAPATTAIDAPVVESIPFVLFPNPTQDRIQIQLQEEKRASYSYLLIGANGVLVERGSIFQDQTQFEIDMKTLPAGIYFLQLNHGQQSTTQRIVKFD